MESELQINATQEHSIAAALSVLALGSPLMTGCANPLATNFYNSGVKKCVKGDYQVLITDHSYAILISSQYAGAYANRGLVKDKLCDVNGFCADVKKAVSLGNHTPAQRLNSENCAWCRNMR